MMQPPRSGMPTQLIANMAQNGAEKPELYAESYARLEDWVNWSLERHKAELRSVLFPLFVLCYFKLVEYHNDEEQLAALFLEQWGAEHALQYASEVRCLAAATRPEHLDTDDFARLVLNRSAGKEPARFRLSLDRVSSELLHSFLASNNLTLLVILLNDSVAISVEDREPRTQMQVAQLSPSGSDLPVAHAEVNWGTFAKPVARGHDAGLPAFTLLGADNASELAPYPKLFSGGPPSVPERLLSSFWLHPQPPYPAESATSSLSRAHPSEVASPRTPSVLLATLVNVQSSLSCVSITPDATQMAAGFADRTVRVWRLDRSELSDEAVELRGHAAPPYALSWSPEQRHLLSGGADGTIRLWDVKTGQGLCCYRAHASPVWDVNFGPAGHYFVSAGQDATCRLWSTDQVQPLRIFAGHYSDVTCATMHPNCAYAASGSCDKTARLWDVATGKCVRVFAGHDAAVSALAFCPSGRYLASGSEDGKVRIWDVASGDEVALLAAHEGPVHSIDYSVEGAVVATGGADSKVLIFDVANAFVASTSRAETTCGLIEPCRTFHTKNTPVAHVRWTHQNLLLAGGAFEVRP